MLGAYRREFGLFVLLFVPGLLLANTLLLVLSFFPLIFVVLDRSQKAPRRIEVVGEAKKLDLWTSDKVEIKRRLLADDGVGILLITLPAPSHARVLSGTTIRVVWKGRKNIAVRLDRTLLVTRRGRYHLGMAGVGVIPASVAEERQTMTIGPEDHLLVSDRMLDIRKLRESRILNRIPRPTKTVGALGSETSDFKEIRHYQQGDRYRSINWKATARQGEGAWPLVNQYEMEGRLTALLLLDNSPVMASGGVEGTALEQGIHAVQSLSHLYLASECEVGFFTFDQSFVVFPGIGRRQGALIARKLLDVEISDKDGDAAGAVRYFPDRLRSGSLVVVVTTIGRENIDALEKGLDRIRRQMGIRGRMIVINIVGDLPTSAPDITGPSVLFDDLMTSTHIRRINAIGATVDNWNPREMNFAQFMMKRFGGRK
ncbi:MAG: DUF58 domain-containing protein [Candidatus Saccharibacteria bacterium]